MAGHLITFEGIDGAGKSSHVQHCATLLQQQGFEVVLTREPGGTELAETLRSMILSQPMDWDTECLLVFAARSDHLNRVIRPALARGAWVVCDRFTDATYAYQGAGRDAGFDRIAVLEQFVHADLQPTRTYWFDVDPQVAASRRQSRGADSDRFEREAEAFFAKVREGYARRAEAAPQRMLRIDGGQSIDAIALQVQADLLALAHRMQAGPA